MLLIHERPEPRPAWRPNWRVVAWLAAAAVIGYASLAAHGALAAALTTAAFGAFCRAFTVALPYGEGLAEWRQ
jgi:hypothetical protein